MAEYEQTTVSCPDCEQTFTGPARGAGSANFKLGTHRYRAHGYKNPNAKKKGRRVGSGPDEDAQPVLAVVRDMADEVGAGKRPPSAAELAKALGRGLSITTIGVASYMAETDTQIPDDDDKARDDLVDYLSLPQKHAENVMAPVARLIASTPLNKKYGRTLIENVDVVESVSEVTKLVFHWRRYMRIRSEWEAAHRQPAQGVYIPPPGASPAAVTPTVPMNGAAPPGVDVTDAMQGVVLTAEDVAAMAQN